MLNSSGNVEKAPLLFYSVVAPNTVNRGSLLKVSKAETCSKTHTIPELTFEDQDLTSFSGLVLFHALFQRLDIKRRIRDCTRGIRTKASYRAAPILLLLITHLLLGWRRLRDLDHYRDDPLFRRTVGMNKVPSVSTLSRFLKTLDRQTADRYRLLSRELVLERIVKSCPTRITFHFDGSVLSTKSRTTEGSAIGFNRKSKGSRSYYPLFATVAQTAQVFDYHHRPGNVHDSQGACGFILDSFQAVRETGFRGELEACLDSAFFSDEILFSMAFEDISFTASAPFLRFPTLKEKIESCKRWHRINETWSFIEVKWKPKSWKGRLRIVVYRQLKKKPTKGPIQLDLFEPIHREYEYKAVVTNRLHRAKAVLEFHNGRGSQEGIFAELKTQSQMGYIPSRRRIGNEIYLTSAVMAHNLNREMQMLHSPPVRRNSARRACLWCFEQLDTIRKSLIQRAGRLTRPKRKLTLSIALNKKTQSRFLSYLNALQDAA